MDPKSAVRWAGSMLSEAIVIAGASGIAYGTWLYSQPLGFVVGGALAVTGGVALEFVRGRR